MIIISIHTTAFFAAPAPLTHSPTYAPLCASGVERTAKQGDGAFSFAGACRARAEGFVEGPVASVRLRIAVDQLRESRCDARAIVVRGTDGVAWVHDSM